MAEFIWESPIFLDLLNIYREVENEPYELGVSEDSMFNEAYYQCCRIVHSNRPDYLCRRKEMEVVLMSEPATDLCMSIIYVLLSHMDTLKSNAIRFTGHIQKDLQSKKELICFPKFKALSNRYGSEGKTFHLTFEHELFSHKNAMRLCIISNGFSLDWINTFLKKLSSKDSQQSFLRFTLRAVLCCKSTFMQSELSTNYDCPFDNAERSLKEMLLELNAHLDISFNDYDQYIDDQKEKQTEDKAKPVSAYTSSVVKKNIGKVKSGPSNSIENKDEETSRYLDIFNNRIINTHAKQTRIQSIIDKFFNIKNPTIQKNNQLFFILFALKEVNITKPNLNDKSFVREIIKCYPYLKSEYRSEDVAIDNISKSISHERSRWKYNDQSKVEISDLARIAKKNNYQSQKALINISIATQLRDKVKNILESFEDQ